jgi:predicted NAD/FAD-dependent oxidoreductase
VERGAEFLHGTGTSAWDIARDSGFALLEDVEFDLDDDVFVFLKGERWFSADIAGDPELSRVFGADLNFSNLADIDEGTGSVEQAIASLGLGPLATRLLEQDAALEQSGQPSEMSALAIDNEVIAAGGDFRFELGYDQLIEQLGRGVPVVLSTPVETVDWSDETVEITTASGVIEANYVVITVSVAALQAELIEFDPPLPAAKQDAIDGLGMGFLAKLLLRYDEPFWPEGTSNVLTDGDPQHWWMPAVTREQDDVDAVITGFATQTFADRVAGMSEEQVRAIAAEELVRIFGPAAGPDHIEDFSFVDWSADAWARGGYSYVRVGHDGAREALAAAVDGRLFFAGEATHAVTPVTTHGAIDSGARAAREIVALAHEAASRGGERRHPPGTSRRV